MGLILDPFKRLVRSVFFWWGINCASLIYVVERAICASKKALALMLKKSRVTVRVQELYIVYFVEMYENACHWRVPSSTLPLFSGL